MGRTATSEASPTSVTIAPRTNQARGRISRAIQPPRILAIDPGTRSMGVAFFVGKDLIRADVENIREPGMSPADTVSKTRDVVRRWIGLYRPTIICLEEPYFSQSRRSATLRRVTHAIARLAAHESLTLHRYPPTTIRRFVCRETRPTRLAVARIIATEHFPWLQRFYEREARKSWWRKRYWTSMFDAIALGLACLGHARASETSRPTA